MAYGAGRRRGFYDTAMRARSDAELDAGLRSYMLRVYNHMAGGLALTGLVAYAAAAWGFYEQITGTRLVWLVILAPFAFLLALTFGIDRMSAATVSFLFWCYAAIMGLSIAGVFFVFTGESVARVFFVTAATFAAISLYGYTTKTDLTRFDSFLLMGLIGIVIASIVNIFIGSSVLQFAVSAIGVLVFVGLTAYETQRIKGLYFAREADEAREKTAILRALALYLDCVNLFMLLLQLFGQRREE